MTTRILVGDCREVLAGLPAASVHCVVTSPPYYGLRDYGTGTWNGGDPACNHIVGELRTGTGLAALGERYAGGGHKAGNAPGIAARDVCPHCGAQRVDRQIGLEATPADYVAEMVDVFRAVRRVLRPDGTLWLNLGDSYAGSWGAQSRSGAPSDKSTLAGNGHVGGGPKLKALPAYQINAAPEGKSHTGSLKHTPGLKPKDLMGIPWRVAFALQDDGWYLRQDIIWNKPNPMPESVTDRCTKAHEYLFLLSKSEKYYYNSDAIAENRTSDEDANGFRGGAYTGGAIDNATMGKRATVGNKRVRGVPPHHAQYESSDQSNIDQVGRGGRRNKRSVWTVATAPFREAHFATFPPNLIVDCIKAGCPSGGTVLDPFFGAGTTGVVADRLGANCIGIELNPAYAEMARQRILKDSGLFGDVA